MGLRISDMAPLTNRDAYDLALVHNGMSPNKMADALAQNAVVADIGAGRSTFGTTIAGLRSDITWYNVDLHYWDKGRLGISPPEAPSNVHYVSGDIARDANNFPLAQGSVDRVYSSALMPHLIMSSRQIGYTVVHTMARLMKPDGEVSVSGFGFFDRAKFSYDVYHADPDGVAAAVVDRLALPRGTALMQRIDNIGSWILRRPFSLIDYIPSQSY
jgi:hypothetical protein